MGLDRYQLIIFCVVVGTLFLLGFLLGQWLHTLAPSLSDALTAAWDWLRSLFSRPGVRLTGTTPGATCPAGQSVVDGVCQWPVIDVYPEGAA